MIDNHINNKKSIKYYINQYLNSLKNSIKKKVVIDIPAGNGSTSEILYKLGADVRPFDLFPEYFMFDDLQCKRADIMKGIPMDDKSSDMIICQEGIEHFSNQLEVFKEFNRVLSKNGELIITTPSYSNLSSKFSYMLFESEISKKMPPNEIDDIWMSDKTITNEIYHGHIFLIGLQKLRVLGKLSGFRIKEIKYLRLSKGSIFLFPIFYPLILIRSLLVYRRYLKRNKKTSIDKKIDVYKEQLFININPLNLLNKHTFITFTKECDVETINFRNEEIVKKFNKTM